MASKKKSQWRTITSKKPLDYHDPEVFQDVKEKTRSVSMNSLTAMQLLPPGKAEVLIAEFEALKGPNQSDAGAFGMLDVGLSVAMVGEPEQEWFRKVAIFARRMVNALLDKPLDDARDPSENIRPLNQLLAQGDRKRIELVMELQMSASAIEQAFPAPQRGRS